MKSHLQWYCTYLSSLVILVTYPRPCVEYINWIHELTFGGTVGHYPSSNDCFIRVFCQQVYIFIRAVYVTQFYKTVDIRTFFKIHFIGFLFSTGKDESAYQVIA